MSLRINNNIAAINALRNLNNTTLNLNKSLQRLSSGLRINSAADDPAGLIISEQLRGQISSLQAASRNVSEGTNFLNIGERALEEVNNLLVSMRALAVYHEFVSRRGIDPARVSVAAYGEHRPVPGTPESLRRVEVRLLPAGN